MFSLGTEVHMENMLSRLEKEDDPVDPEEMIDNSESDYDDDDIEEEEPRKRKTLLV